MLDLLGVFLPVLPFLHDLLVKEDIDLIDPESIY